MDHNSPILPITPTHKPREPPANRHVCEIHLASHSKPHYDPHPEQSTMNQDVVAICDEPDHSPPPPQRQSRRNRSDSRSRTKSMDESSIVSDADQVTITSSRKSVGGRRSISVSRRGRQDSDTPNITWADLEVVKQLGGGVSGQVKLCKYKPNGNMYAVKCIPLGDHANREMFMYEAEVLNNPTLRESSHIVRYLDTFYDDETQAMQLILELMDRGSLESLITQYYPDGMKNNYHLIASIAYQMLSGILLLHRNNMLHRDLKPANVLMNSSGQVKLADFGLLVHLNDQQTLKDAAGSLPWKSPERHAGEYAYPADIWSFGLIIYYLVTGREAFPSPVQLGFELRMQNERPVLKKATIPGTDEQYDDKLADFIDSAIAYDHIDRLTAEELISHEFLTEYYIKCRRHVNFSKLWRKEMDMVIEDDFQDDESYHGELEIELGDDGDDDDDGFEFEQTEFERETSSSASQQQPSGSFPLNLQSNRASFFTQDDQSLFTMPKLNSNLFSPQSINTSQSSFKLPSMALPSMKLPAMAPAVLKNQRPPSIGFDDESGIPISPIKSISIPPRFPHRDLSQRGINIHDTIGQTESEGHLASQPNLAITNHTVSGAKPPTTEAEQRIAERVAAVHAQRMKLLHGDDPSDYSDSESDWSAEDENSSCNSLPMDGGAGQTSQTPQRLVSPLNISTDSLGFADPTQGHQEVPQPKANGLGSMKLPKTTPTTTTAYKPITPKHQLKHQLEHPPEFVSFADEHKNHQFDPTMRKSIVQQKQRQSVHHMIFDDHPKTSFVLPTKPLALPIATHRLAMQQPQQHHNFTTPQSTLSPHSHHSSVLPHPAQSVNTGVPPTQQSQHLPHKSYQHHHSVISPQSYSHHNMYDDASDSDDDLLDMTRVNPPLSHTQSNKFSSQRSIPYERVQTPHKLGYPRSRYSIDHSVQREAHPFQPNPTSPHSTNSNHYNKEINPAQISTLNARSTVRELTQQQSHYSQQPLQHKPSQHRQQTIEPINPSTPRSIESTKFLLPAAHSIISASFTPIKQRQQRQLEEHQKEQQAQPPQPNAQPPPPQAAHPHRPTAPSRTLTKSQQQQQQQQTRKSLEALINSQRHAPVVAKPAGKSPIASVRSTVQQIPVKTALPLQSLPQKRVTAPPTQVTANKLPPKQLSNTKPSTTLVSQTPAKKVASIAVPTQMGMKSGPNSSIPPASIQTLVKQPVISSTPAKQTKLTSPSTSPTTPVPASQRLTTRSTTQLNKSTAQTPLKQSTIATPLKTTTTTKTKTTSSVSAKPTTISSAKPIATSQPAHETLLIHKTQTTRNIVNGENKPPSASNIGRTPLKNQTKIPHPTTKTALTKDQLITKPTPISKLNTTARQLITAPTTDQF